MAGRNQLHRLFGVVLGSVLAAGLAGASMACEVDEGELEGGVQANSMIVVEEAPGRSNRDGGYVFVDVGAWDDTNLTWPTVDPEITAEMSVSGGYKFLEVGAWDDTKSELPAFRPMPEDDLGGQRGYKFLDVGAWDDTKSELPVFLPMPKADPAGRHGYKFLDVAAWDDTDIDWP